MWHWLHHLFSPHCHECQLAAEESKVCQSCETLKMQLSIANHEKQEMLNTILALSKPAEREQTSPAVDYEKLRPRMTTWNVRKQMLEAEDRKAAQVLAEQKKKSIGDQIADLEKEVGLEEGVKSDA